MKYVGILIGTLIFFQSVTACEKATYQNFVQVQSSSQSERIYPIAIIGSGAAGMMAVKRSVLNNNEVLLFLGVGKEARHGRGNWVRKVENIPGLEACERTILELRESTLNDLAESPLVHNLHVVNDSVCAISKEGDLFRLWDGSGKDYYANYVVLATGVMNIQPHIQGSIRPVLPYANSQAIGYCVICDGHRSFGKKTVVIGHTESAAYTALRLVDLYQPPRIMILTNGQAPEFSFSLLKKLQAHQIAIDEEPILEVVGNSDLGWLNGFRLESGRYVEAEAGFISLGVIPNNQLALQLNVEVDEEGLIITDCYGETSIPNFFVAGDLRADGMMQIYSAWQNAVDSIQEINWRIREKVK